MQTEDRHVGFGLRREAVENEVVAVGGRGVIDALEDEQIRQATRANTRGNFAYAFDDKLTDLFIGRNEQNEELFTEYLSDDELRELVTTLLRQEVYEASQEPAES